MADNIMTFRMVVKEVALEQGLYATFMPKPFTDHPGSGMHTHLSLFEGDRNAFHEAGAEYQLSKVARQFIAGLLEHSAEITAVTNQWVNSYKRLWGGGEAPTYVCWGHNNRSALIRVPMYKPGKGQSTRIEYRALDSACNPYLAFAMMLSAGMRGIEDGLDLPDGAEDDVWTLTDSERRALGIKPLPGNLNEAIRSCRSPNWSPRPSGRGSSTSSCGTSGRSGTSTAGRSPRSSSTGTCPCCDAAAGPDRRAPG